MTAGDPPPASAPLARVLPLVFLSGACALVYQVVWTRELRLVFGASTPASAAVVAIFVGGLGLGAWKIGARVERTAAPLSLYSLLELGVAGSSLATLLLIPAAARVYVALGGTVVLGVAGATVVRLLLATLVLAVPTVLMGGTLPALARAVVAGSHDAARRGVALLYALNTLGAVTGCLVANFLLLERLGATLTLALAAAINFLVGGGAAWVGGSVADIPPEATQGPDAPASAPPPFVLVASAVVGFAFFLMELVFYRLLVPLLGGTVYTFGLVLAAALLGIGIGSALYSALFARGVPAMAAFATSCLLEAACLAAPYALGDRLAVLAIVLRPMGALGFGGYVAGWSVVTAIVVLPASIAAGAQFPILVALLGRGGRQVARHVGLAYAWNSAGAIAGALAGGFGLMPLLTAPGCWRLATELLATVGLAATVGAWRARRRSGVLVAQLALATATVALVRGAAGPTAAWRHSPIGAGRVGLASVDSPEHVESFTRDARRDIGWEADGIESTVGMNRNGGYAFSTNAKSDGHCREDAGTQVMGGLLGAILHPHPASAMVIGLGSGSTAGWLARVPGIERVDVVELEPAMLEVARRCAPVNEHALDNPKLHVLRGDAREVLSVTPARYDVVFSEPSNPYRAGVASLYTREYYARVRAHLGDGGVFLQWVQGYEIDAPTMRTIFATMASEYPYVEAWQLEWADLVLVASREPIVKDVGALRARIAGEPFARALRSTWDVEDLEGVLAHFVARPSFARAIADEHRDPLNTDDRPVAEFGFAQSVGKGRPDTEAVGVETILGRAAARHEGRPELVGGAVDWERVGLARAEIPCLDRREPGTEGEGDESDDVRERLEFERRWIASDAKGALAAWDARPREPLTPTELLDVAQAAVREQDPRAANWVERLMATRPLEALALQATMLEADKKYDDAADAVERALVGYRSDPWPQSAVMYGALFVAERIASGDASLAPRMAGLVSQPFAIEMLRDQRLFAAYHIESMTGGMRQCVQVLAPFEPHTPWQKALLEYRRDCYRGAGDARAALAQRELTRFLEQQRVGFGM